MQIPLDAIEQQAQEQVRPHPRFGPVTDGTDLQTHRLQISEAYCIQWGTGFCKTTGVVRPDKLVARRERELAMLACTAYWRASTDPFAVATPVLAKEPKSGVECCTGSGDS